MNEQVAHAGYTQSSVGAKPAEGAVRDPGTLVPHLYKWLQKGE